MLDLFTGDFTADRLACLFKAELLCLRSGRIAPRSQYYRELFGLEHWPLLDRIDLAENLENKIHPAPRSALSDSACGVHGVALHPC